jgi:hypothetical protein
VSGTKSTLPTNGTHTPRSAVEGRTLQLLEGDYPEILSARLSPLRRAPKLAIKA